MPSLNKVMIIGNVGSEPELRFTPNGRQVCTFRVATNRKYKNNDGELVEETEWFSVATWGRLAEVVNQYVQKGSPIYVEGRLKTHSWDDESTGVKKYRTELIAQRVEFLGRPVEPQGGEDFEPEDVPF